MILSIAIMAVPSRSEHVATLEAALVTQITTSRAAGDDVRYVGVSMDAERAGPWANWQQAAALRSPDATHHAILQDDVVPCADLPATLTALIRARPEAVISGFLPRKSVEKAHAADLRWVACRSFLWAQCVVIPTATLTDMLIWIAGQEAERGAVWKQHDDSRIGDYLKSRKQPVYVPVPNVVEHIGDAIGGSTMGHNFAPERRRARVWLGADGEGRLINWSDLREIRE